MLIIGHRGAAGLAPENSIAALRAGLKDGADVLEFDVRLTADNVPVVLHDADLNRTHKLRQSIRSLTLEQLHDLALTPAIPTLEEVMKSFFGKTILNIEVKSRGMTEPVLKILDQFCGDSKNSWDTVFISSFLVKELVSFRKKSSRVNLALLHDNNPFLYIAYQRRVDFTAVGFHRLHMNRLATAIAKKANIFTYAYTADRPKSAKLLEDQGMDGIVTDYPSKIANALDQA